MNLISVFNLFYLKENENSVTFYYKESYLSKPIYLNLWAKHNKKDESLNMINKLQKTLPELMMESSKLFKNNEELKNKFCNNIIHKQLYSLMDYDYAKNNSEKNPFSLQETKLVLQELKSQLGLTLLEEDHLSIDLNNLDWLSTIDLLLSEEISWDLKKDIIENILKHSFKFRNSIKAILQSKDIPEEYKIIFKEQLNINNRLLDINKLPFQEKIDEKKKLLMEMKENMKSNFNSFWKTLTKVSVLSVLWFWIGFSSMTPWTALQGNVSNSTNLIDFEFSLFNVAHAAPRSSTSNSSSSNSYSDSSDYRSPSSSSSDDYGSDYSSPSSSNSDGSDSDYSSPSSSNSNSYDSDWGATTSSFEEDPCPSYQSESVTEDYNIKDLNANIDFNLRWNNSQLSKILNMNNIKGIYFEDKDTDYKKDLDGCEVTLKVTEEYSYGWSPSKYEQKVYYYFTDYNESLSFKTSNWTKSPYRVWITLNNWEVYKIEKTSSPDINKSVIEAEYKTINYKINSFELKFPDFKTKVNYDFNNSNSKAIYTYYTEEDTNIWADVFIENNNSFKRDVKRTYFTHINSSYSKEELAEILKKPQQPLTLNIQDTKVRKISGEFIGVWDKIQIEKDWVVYNIEVISDWSEKLWKWFIILLKWIGIVAGTWIALYLANDFIKYVREQDIVFDVKEGLGKTKIKFIETFNKVVNKFKNK